MIEIYGYIKLKSHPPLQGGVQVPKHLRGVFYLYL